MPTIKLTADGKVILKDGKVSCQCCETGGGGGGGFSCDGLWGPGYDSHPSVLTITAVSNDPYMTEGVPVTLTRTLTRVSKCLWKSIEGGCEPHSTFGNNWVQWYPYGEGYWTAHAAYCNNPENGSGDKNIVLVGNGWRYSTTFIAGPIGSYTLSPNDSITQSISVT